MRSALAKVPEIYELTAKAGSPGSASFMVQKQFDYRKALDKAVADGLSALEGYKVLD